MKSFEDYTFANISEKDNSEIKKLEDQIKQGTGEDVVLIAYREKENTK